MLLTNTFFLMDLASVVLSQLFRSANVQEFNEVFFVFFFYNK